MIEIIFICLSALITLGVSINSILSSHKKDEELKIQQDSLMNAQTKINEKSEEIIKLQQELREKSEIQIKNLERLNNPIPSYFKIDLFAKIKTKELELNKLSQVSAGNGNLLPSTNENSVSRIDKLKNSQIILKITFTKGEKTMTIKFHQTPLLLLGYNTDKLSGTFSIAPVQNSLSFIGTNLITQDIKTNYTSPSLLDFKDSKINLKITFGYANRTKIGDIYTDIYLIGANPEIDVEITNFYLSSNRLDINIKDFKEKEGNVFTSDWKIER